MKTLIKLIDDNQSTYLRKKFNINLDIDIENLPVKILFDLGLLFLKDKYPKGIITEQINLIGFAYFELTKRLYNKKPQRGDKQ